MKTQQPNDEIAHLRALLREKDALLKEACGHLSKAWEMAQSQEESGLRTPLSLQADGWKTFLKKRAFAAVEQPDSSPGS